jgi:type IV pilus assembly protein PilE
MQKQHAFTLIELMVTVAIIGILASIAYPSYTSSVQKSRRSDAIGALEGFVNAMERKYTETNSYLGLAGTQATPTNTGSPWIYATQSPINGGTPYYNLTINAATASSYTLYAAPINADKCGTLTIDQTGAKNITGQDTGVTSADCWK